MRIARSALGLLFLSAFSLSLYVAQADDIDDFLAGPPYPGGLPACLGYLATSDAEHEACQAELAVFEGQVNECQEVVDDLQAEIGTLSAQLSDCLAAVGEFPGDGVTGTALSFSHTGATVLDNLTHLEWEVKTSLAFVTYAQALAHVAALNAANFQGSNTWRLPRIKEVLSVFDYSAPPVITTSGIIGVVLPVGFQNVWSMTPGTLAAGRQVADMRFGGVTSIGETSTARVIAVR